MSPWGGEVGTASLALCQAEQSEASRPNPESETGVRFFGFASE